jgi:hypothetical protein
MLVIQIQIFKEQMNVTRRTLSAEGLWQNAKSAVFLVAGGGERIRTDDPLRARQVLSQLSYTPD